MACLASTPLLKEWIATNDWTNILIWSIANGMQKEAQQQQRNAAMIRWLKTYTIEIPMKGTKTTIFVALGAKWTDVNGNKISRMRSTTRTGRNAEKEKQTTKKHRQISYY